MYLIEILFKIEYYFIDRNDLSRSRSWKWRYNLFYKKYLCSCLLYIVIFIYVTLFNLDEDIFLEQKFKDLFLCYSTKKSNYIIVILGINILLINFSLNNFKQRPTQLEYYLFLHYMKWCLILVMKVLRKY